tara:strand:- start:1934 stop:3580 length:1647 start_codon:yes stop_codon:yes gene_type:complete
LEFDLPRDIEGGYRLLRKIGEGGMGVVYEGIHLVLERPVAIKMMLPNQENSEEAQTVAKRFLREAKTIAKIQSDHVVDITHFGQTKLGELFLVMEFIKGCSLAQYLRHCKKLSPEVTCHIGAQVASGLMSAHSEGVIHRDLKAANVMLTQKGNDKLFAKVLDFGVAKLADDSDKTLTQAGLMVGTLSTMSPEQITGAPVDHRSDIYSMGVLLYRMLSGLRLFEVTDVAGISYHHVHVKPKPLLERAPELQVPDRLEDIIFRCLEKKPGERFQKMQDVVMALKDVFADQRFDMVTDTGNYLIESSHAPSDQPTRTILAVDPNTLSNAAQPSPVPPRIPSDYISESLSQTLTGIGNESHEDATMATQQGVSLNSSHVASRIQGTSGQQAAWLKPVLITAAVFIIGGLTWGLLNQSNAPEAPNIKEGQAQEVVDVKPQAPVPPPVTPKATPTPPTVPVVEATQPPQAPANDAAKETEQEVAKEAPKEASPPKAVTPKPRKRKSTARKKEPASPKEESGFIRTSPKKKKSGFIRTTPKKEGGSNSFRRVQTQ